MSLKIIKKAVTPQPACPTLRSIPAGQAFRFKRDTAGVGPTAICYKLGTSFLFADQDTIHAAYLGGDVDGRADGQTLVFSGMAKEAEVEPLTLEAREL